MWLVSQAHAELTVTPVVKSGVLNDLDANPAGRVELPVYGAHVLDLRGA
ncbi:hypothetical protein ABZ721_10385 [Streptomyces sp. NPDC006733]